MDFTIFSAYMPQPPGGSPFLPYPQPGFPTPGGYGGFPPYPPTSNPPYPSPYPPTSSTSFPSPYPGYSPYPLNNFGGSPATPSSIPVSTGTIKDEHIRESLLTAIEEKLLRRMKEQFQQNQAELETLKRTQDELKQGRAKLDAILSRLTKEQVKLFLIFVRKCVYLCAYF